MSASVQSGKDRIPQCPWTAQPMFAILFFSWERTYWHVNDAVRTNDYFTRGSEPASVLVVEADCGFGVGGVGRADGVAMVVGTGGGSEIGRADRGCEGSGRADPAGRL